jgi:hypothetical protein
MLGFATRVLLPGRDPAKHDPFFENPGSAGHGSWAKPELLVRKLHHSVAMENDAFWTETVAKEFEALDDLKLQGATESDEDESAQLFSNEMDIDEMARLLAGGM